MFEHSFSSYSEIFVMGWGNYVFFIVIVNQKGLCKAEIDKEGGYYEFIEC